MRPTEWNPGRLLETSGYYWQTCTLHAGVKLDVFTVIGKKRMTAAEVSGEISGDAQAVTRLLNALSALGLLEKKEKVYANTRAALQFLCKNSPAYIGYMIMHHQHLVASWSRLDEAVRTGKSVRSSVVTDRDDETRESFLMGMFNLAMELAPRLVEKISMADRHHLLDLGGGPGTYAIHFCQKNPQLRATVFDLPTTEPFARKTIERFGLSDRIDFMKGNYLEDGIRGKYDAAWLSHVLHGEGPDDCRMIIQKAVSALEPGGMIIIHEFILDNSGNAPLFPALFSLNMLLATDRGQAYTEAELTEMLREAGVGSIHRIAVQTPNESGIIAGTIP